MKTLVFLFAALIAIPASAQNFPGIPEITPANQTPAATDVVPTDVNSAVPVPADVSAGMISKMVTPRYSPFAMEANVRGSVLVSAVINDRGEVTHAEVLSGPAPLHQSALAALAQWTYQPYMVDGKAVPMDTTITVHFKPEPTR